MNRRLYNTQSFLEKTIYRVPSLAINNFHQSLLKGYLVFTSTL